MPDEAPLVLHIIHRLGTGGLENGLVNLINSMPPSSYRHAVVCMAGYTEFASRLRREDVKIYDLKKAPGKDFIAYWRLFKLLRRLRPSIVHTRNIGTLDCQFIAFAAGVKCRIHGEHGWDIEDPHGNSRKYAVLRRLSQLVVDRYVTVSQHLKEWLENAIGIAGAKISQIYNGIDSERFFPASRNERLEAATSERVEIVVGTVGRLDPIKDHLTMIRGFAEALKGIAGSNTTARLIIVGDGEMRSSLTQEIERLGLQSAVILPGESDNVANVLRSFDVFVLSSLNEGISNTILEAMATGLPVVASEVGGNPELVEEGITGMMFAPGDHAELADKLIKYFEDGDSRTRHGAAGRVRATSEFSPARMMENYLELYDRGLAVVGDPRRAIG